MEEIDKTRLSSFKRIVQKTLVHSITYAGVFLISFTVVFAQQNTVSIISYNALHGFNGDDKLQKKYEEWVNTLDTDLVFYQELNGFSQEKLRNLGLAYGHPHSVILNEESGLDVTHPIGITSRMPITNVEMHVDTMWHGYIYAKIGEIHCFITHLAPFTLNDRRNDLNRIIDHASTFQNEKILIAGDFNALSAIDSAHYGTRLLTSMKRIEGRLEPKSGTPIVKNRTIYRNNLNEGSVDYSVMQLLEEAGFIDSYYILNSEFKNSAPTKGYASANSILRRIDYIWVSPVLADRIIYADIIQNEITEVLSDHYPVIVKVKLD